MKICCNKDQKKKKRNTVINKQCRLDYLGVESNGYIELITLLFSICMGSVILLSVLPFFDSLKLFKQVSVSVCIICIGALCSFN